MHYNYCMHDTITEFDIVVRMFLGFIAGGIIGFERSSRRQVAGLRTHILIALGSDCLMLLSIWLPQVYLKGSDPGRIAAQVVSGIGFLGAGAIIRLGNNVKGLTTAASLWLVAAIGMAIGAGMYIAAIAAEVLGLFSLMVLGVVERRIFPEIKSKLLEVHYNHSAEPDTGATLEILKSFGIEHHSINVKVAEKKGETTSVHLLVSIPETVDIPTFARSLKSSGDICRVQIKENI